MSKKTTDDGRQMTENDAAVQQYRCLSPIEHQGDHRIYLPGAVITLEHLTPDLIQRLVDGGHVVVVGATAGAATAGAAE